MVYNFCNIIAGQKHTFEVARLWRGNSKVDLEDRSQEFLITSSRFCTVLCTALGKSDKSSFLVP